MTQIKQFFDSIFGSAEAHLYGYLWTLVGHTSYWHQAPLVESFLSQVDHLQKSGIDIYFGVALSRTDNGPGRRAEKSTAAAIGALWADIDILGPVHQKTNLPRTQEEALAIIPADTRPTWTVHSGHGLQLYWVFKEIWEFDSEPERDRAQDLALRWQKLLSWRAGLRGFNIDAVHDLARVMRVPGSTNYKDPSEPVEARIIDYSGIFYNPSELIDLVDEAKVTSTPANPIATPDVAVGNLIINPAVEFPQDMIDGYLAVDPMFAQTWNNQRVDLGDRTGSGYCMSLANFGVRAGLNDQQIMNLIMHWRRIHGAPQKTNQSTWRGTIRKARERSMQSAGIPWESLPTAEHDPRTPAGSEPAEDEPADVELRRAKLCEEISNTILPDKYRQSHRILRVVKFDSLQEPSWTISFANGKDVSFVRAAQITQFGEFSQRVSGALNFMIISLSPKGWRIVAGKILEAAEIDEAGWDQESPECVRESVTEYLMQNHPANSYKECFNGTGKSLDPYLEDGQAAIHPVSFAKWLRGNNDLVNRTTVNRRLASIGGVQREIIPPGRAMPQNRWYLPSIYTPEQSKKAAAENLESAPFTKADQAEETIQ